MSIYTEQHAYEYLKRIAEALEKIAEARDTQPNIAPTKAPEYPQKTTGVTAGAHPASYYKSSGKGTSGPVQGPTSIPPLATAVTANDVVVKAEPSVK